MIHPVVVQLKMGDQPQNPPPKKGQQQSENNGGVEKTQ
jgi:hypothetical protein